MPTVQPSESVRTVSAPDPDGAGVTQFIVPGAQSLAIGAVCDAPGKTLSLTVYFLNSLRGPGRVARIQFTSPGTPEWGITPAAGTTPAQGTYAGTPSYDPCWPMGGASAYAVKVDAVSGGNWTISGTTS